jgi:cobyrinic acid a,c-diamide synthase
MMPKGFVVAGPSSGAGKTTVTLGLMAALKRRGLIVQPFKCGPDFIDPGHHERVCERPSRTLDGWMLGPAANQAIFIRHAASADVSVAEGVMGLFDGASQSSGVGSTAEMATLLGIPILFVVDASKMAASAAALVHGFATFDPAVRLAGVIFNKVGSASHYRLLKDALERAGETVALGYLPRDEQLRIPERYLGLVTADECVLSEQAVAHLADLIEQHVDLDGVLNVAGGVAGRPETVESPPAGLVRIGIARDRAFCFYYEDNFDALRAAGADLVAFSPLDDRELPDALDALYFGGGYPELWAEGLTANVKMQEAVQRFIESGRAVYAECGGLMYLAQSIQGRDGRTWPMIGALPFNVVMTERLQRFGYVEVTLTHDCVLGAAGTTARGHSFHCSRIADVPSDIPLSYRLRYTLARAEEGEGFSVGSVLASYIHLHFQSNPGLAREFVRRVARSGSGPAAAVATRSVLR